MNSIYIVIKNMRVINANLSSSYFTVDLPQNAYLGFAHNLARYLDKEIPKEKDYFGNIERAALGNEKSFAILKQFELNQGHASFVGHLNDNNHKALNIPMNPPEIKGTIKQTLVIQLSTRNYNFQDLKKWVRAFLFFNRFSGGDIQKPDSLEINILNSDKLLEESLQQEKGWVVKDATDQLIEKAQKTDYSHAFCDFLSTFKIIEKGKQKKDDKVIYQRRKGWFYASLAGYQLLEARKKRQGARYNYPHAFAEPIIGLHQLEYFRKQSPQSLFWSGELKNHIYRLTQGI